MAVLLVFLAAALASCTAAPAAPALPEGTSVEPPVGAVRIGYGHDPDNFGDLFLPPGNTDDALPVVVLVHGGGWIQRNNLDYMAKIAADLAVEGVAVWSIEYRRVHGTGGWSDTLSDVTLATDALAGVVQKRSGGRLDLDRVHVAGHSAGGHLAAWLATRPTLDDDPEAPGPTPQIILRSATIMAGVLDLDLAATNGHDKAVRELIGGVPADYPHRYATASPIQHLPIGVPVTVLHGDKDTTVSPEQSRSYARAAVAAGDPATLVMVPGAGHGSFVNVPTRAWREAKAVIAGHVFGEQ